jgi:hypothetical protein
MRRAALLTLALLVFTSGCRSHSHSRQTVVARLQPGEPLAQTTVPADTTYGIFVTSHPDGSPAAVTAKLSKGTAVGFQTRPDGSVLAHAGESWYSLPAGDWEWRVVSDCKPSRWSKLMDHGPALVVGTVVTGVFVLTAMIVVALSQSGGFNWM